MGLRPASAHWFEIVVPERTPTMPWRPWRCRGRIQFEWLGARAETSEPQRLQEPIARYRTLARDYELFRQRTRL